ncbi:hypothetical protein B0H16DRAFT_1497258 [Mycena metata]|uniref:GmrSD restriction endonucleases N-terminal domain-containing protein n=1 Tax=Mycena metata TaxID=1033252 RepID=A0AAD7NYY2_9AGAR|nr:hypothetical protein B0H16DRAFT_1497258 [Mycena metata]
MHSPVSLDRGSASNFQTPPPLPSKSRTSSPQKRDEDLELPYDDGYGSDEDAPPETTQREDGFQIRGEIVRPKTENLTIRELHSMIHEGTIDLNPSYQREVVWPASRQSLLIDSIFRNVWIPPVLFSVNEDEDGIPTRVCVDGKQRLTSIQRFMDGQLPYIQSKKEHYYYTSPESSRSIQKLPLPDDIKEMFASKSMTCVVYTDLTPALEREIFQRVQLGMQLTTAEKLAAIDSAWSRWIARLEGRHISIEGGLSQVLNWDTQRGRDFQNVAHFVYCCDGYPDQNVPTAAKMEKWLSRVDPPGEQFKRDIDNALSEFGRIATDPALNMGFSKVSKRIAPVEFVFIGVLIYVLRDATPMERAQAIYHLRTDIREQFLDIRLNSTVGGGLWALINHLKHNPTLSFSGIPVASTSKRKRKQADDEDDDYHPSPIRSLGKNPKTRSRHE